jgi:hypothetical protein
MMMTVPDAYEWQDHATNKFGENLETILPVPRTAIAEQEEVG